MLWVLERIQAVLFLEVTWKLGQHFNPNPTARTGQTRAGLITILGYLYIYIYIISNVHDIKRGTGPYSTAAVVSTCYALFMWLPLMADRSDPSSKM